MPANVPESDYEERLADAVKRSWLNPRRTRVLSDLLGDHRTNLKLFHAEAVQALGLTSEGAVLLLDLIRKRF